MADTDNIQALHQLRFFNIILRYKNCTDSAVLRIQKHRQDTAHRHNAAVKVQFADDQGIAEGLRFDHSGGRQYACSDSKIERRSAFRD